MTPPLLETVDRYLSLIRNTLRQYTVRGYRIRLNGFVRFLHSRFPEATSFNVVKRDPHIESWLRFLREKQPPYTNTTYREHLTLVRRFFWDIWEWNWAEAPETELVRRSDFPPRDHHLPKPLTPEFDRRLQDALRHRDDLPARGLLIARFTGIRLGELLRLERDCLIRDDRNNFSLRVPLGKLHNERVVPVDLETARLIETVQKHCGDPPPARDPTTGANVKFLLCKPDGSPLGRSKVQRTIRYLGRELNAPDRIYAHRLRHTFATEVVRYGVSIPGVMRALGHHDPRMTLRYVDVTQVDIFESFQAAYARSKQRYSSLAELCVATSSTTKTNSPVLVKTAFEELLARVGFLHLDERQPTRKKRLQRYLERLRRAHQELPSVLR